VKKYGYSELGRSDFRPINLMMQSRSPHLQRQQVFQSAQGLTMCKRIFTSQAMLSLTEVWMSLCLTRCKALLMVITQ